VTYNPKLGSAPHETGKGLDRHLVLGRDCNVGDRTANFSKLLESASREGSIDRRPARDIRDVSISSWRDPDGDQDGREVLWDTRASALTAGKFSAPSIQSKSSRQPAEGKRIVLEQSNMAELKIQVDGLPILVRFPLDEGQTELTSDVDNPAGIPSLLSITLLKLVEHLRKTAMRSVGRPSNPALTSAELDLNKDSAHKPPAAQPVLCVGPLKLDLLDRTAKRGDRQIDLRPREFQLLRYMMERSGKLLTRAALLRDVWQYKFVPQTNRVDVQLGRLRHKIDGPNEPAMIRSVRGAGFVLDTFPLS